MTRRSPLLWLALSSVCLLIWTVGLADDKPGAKDPGIKAVKDRDVLPENVAGNEEVERVLKTFPGRGEVGDDSDPTPAEEAVKLFEAADDLQMELVASEPAVEQPLFLNFDDRGRMWVVQYRQYPYPEGLKIIRYDQHLRAVFDKVPQPPPHGAKGKDKITVFEDTDGDGTYDSSKDVLDGLNIVSSVAAGPGSDGANGIWVLNPPYLLFYPDADRDDVPDADPEVHLAGFGLEDTHSIANSLMWGPDGWLYGANGSTSTGNVSSAVTKSVRWEGQNIWRYHPPTKVFEIFAEGGGNTFSCEMDSKGRNFSGTNYGNTRGMYYSQGSYGIKGWGKHGPLTNPYAFGWFEHMAHEGDQDRFPQTFIIYEGGSLPQEYEGNVISANALHNRVYASELIADGSTYRTVDKPFIVTTPDRWFRPVCVATGPDGGVYIADWYDTRLTHVDPRDNWHKTSGRIYRLGGTTDNGQWTTDTTKWPRDLASLDDESLIALFNHPNKWQRQTAVRVLGTRLAHPADAAKPQAADVVRELKEIALAGDGASLEALWTLNLAGAFDFDLASKLLAHPDQHVRRWTVRLLGDQRRLEDAIAGQLVELAKTEPYVQVRAQMASSAKRFATPYAVPIIRELLQRDEDATDKHIPLLLWWALEQHAGSRDAVLAMLGDPELWDVPMVRDVILARLMQRYAMEDQIPPLPANPHLGVPLEQSAPTAEMSGLDACAALLALAPSAEDSARLMTGFLEAYQGREIDNLPPALAKALDEYQESMGSSDLALALRRGSDDAVSEALKAVGDDAAEVPLRLSYINILGQIGKPQVVGPLLGLLGSNSPAIKRAAMEALLNYDDPKIGATICSRYQSTLPAEHGLRSTAHQVLAARPDWTKQFLAEITAHRIKQQTVPLDIVQQMRLHDDAEIQATLDELWGKTRSTPEEKLQQVSRLRALITDRNERSASNGRELFKKHCGVCHTLFDDGGQTGPNLTGYERTNLDFLLLAIVDPSAAIREEFTQYQIVTNDGRVLTGLIDQQTPTTVTLRGANNQQTLLNRDDIDILQAMPTSIMPDALVEKFTDEELRDLFSYLMARTPPAS